MTPEEQAVVDAARRLLRATANATAYMPERIALQAAFDAALDAAPKPSAGDPTQDVELLQLTIDRLSGENRMLRRSNHSLATPKPTDEYRRGVEDAVMCVPGGDICSPQQVADAIRTLLEPKPSAVEVARDAIYAPLMNAMRWHKECQGVACPEEMGVASEWVRCERDKVLDILAAEAEVGEVK